MDDAIVRGAAPKSRRSRPLVGLALLVAALVAVLLLVAALRDALDPLARQEREAAFWQAQRIAEQLGWLDLLVAAGWRLLPLVVVGALAVVALVALYRRWATHEYIRAAHLTRALAAQHQHPTVPHALTYSPHYAPHVRTQREALEGETHAAPAPAAVPSFAQLLDSGKVGRGNPLLLGYDIEQGTELAGSWLDLYSTAVSGMPGSGKTTSQRFLACQTVLHGARFAICDPHAGAADDSLAATLAPLHSAFVCEPASSDRAILDVVRYVADVGRRRVNGTDEDHTPLILWVDELTHLLGRSSVADELGELLERVAQEYRKRAVFVCASGQIWTAARTPSELRDSFASVLCHRMKRAQARLLLPADEAVQAERLAVGSAVLWRTSGATATKQIPVTTTADVRRVAGLLATERLLHQPDGSQNEADLQPADMPARSQSVAEAERLRSAAVSAEAARAATLFLDGLDPAAIVWELRQVRSNQGGKYQSALAEVLTLIREGLRGR
jgi:hypothetical protein